MRVSGDSMEPEIMDNDIVLIDQGKRDVTPGRLYAIGFDEAIYLKRIDILPGKVILKSTNAAYPVSYTHLDVYKRQARRHMSRYSGRDAGQLTSAPASIFALC